MTKCVCCFKLKHLIDFLNQMITYLPLHIDVESSNTRTVEHTLIRIDYSSSTIDKYHPCHSLFVCLCIMYLYIFLQFFYFRDRSSKRVVIFVVVKGRRKKENRLSIRRLRAEKSLFKVISSKRNVLFVQKQGTSHKCPVKSSRSE